MLRILGNWQKPISYVFDYELKSVKTVSIVEEAWMRCPHRKLCISSTVLRSLILQNTTTMASAGGGLVSYVLQHQVDMEKLDAAGTRSSYSTFRWSERSGLNFSPLQTRYEKLR